MPTPPRPKGILQCQGHPFGEESLGPSGKVQSEGPKDSFGKDSFGSDWEDTSDWHESYLYRLTAFHAEA